MRSVDQQARHDRTLSRLDMSYEELMPDEQELLERVGKRAGYQTGKGFLQHLQAAKARQH